MAPPFAACRICYRIEGKLKNYKEGDFYETTYEKLTGCTFEDLPWINKFCPHCACLMRKLYKFVKMSRASYYQLTDYLNTGRKVTQPYINKQQEWSQWYHPAQLTSCNAQRMSVVDCVYAPKRSKAKPKIADDFYVRHLAVPKNEAAETTQPKPPIVDDHFDTHERIAHHYMDLEYKEYLESPIENVGEYIDDFVDSDKMRGNDAPVLDAVEVGSEGGAGDIGGLAETVVFAAGSGGHDAGDVGGLVETVVFAAGSEGQDAEDMEGPLETVVYTEGTQAGVKVEECMEHSQDILEDTIEEENEIDIKSERDENLTLQEIKEELKAASVLEECDIAIVDKKKTGSKRKKKDPKATLQDQRQLLRAKRQKTNQELEEQFHITRLSPAQQWAEFRLRGQRAGGRHRCPLCLQAFRAPQWLDSHRRRHEPSAGDYECSICKIRCKTPKLFRTHRDSNHTTKFVCKRCPFITYSKAQALKHHGWHEGVEHTCQHCGASFRKHTTYMGHVRRAHPSAHICGVCARSFVSAYGLNLHVKAVHKDMDRLESDSTRCEECDVTFVSRKMFVRHVLITEKHKEQAKDILGCRKCGEQFECRELLEQHTHYKERRARRAEAPARTVKCDECGEAFGHPNGVYQHHLRAHPDTPYRFAGRRRYLCEACGKTFKSPGLLQQHALVHRGIRPPPAKKPPGRNACRVCGKTYSKLSGLFRHKLTHQGVRRHKCHICEKAFTDTSNLKQHVQGVHLNIRRVRKR